MCYLARRAQSDLCPADERQIDVIGWLNWSSEHFSRFCRSAVFRTHHQGSLRPGGLDAAAVGEANGYVRTYGSGLNAHLHDRKYLADDILTVADFAVVATLPYAEKAFAAIERWDARLNALPAWRDPFPAAKKPA